MIPETLKNTLFSLIKADAQTENDKKLNNFLLDIYNQIKSFYEKDDSNDTYNEAKKLIESRPA